MKAQLESLEKEKQAHQDATDDIQRIKSEADEQIQKERAERSTEVAAFEKTIESGQFGKAINPDELFDPNQELHKQKKNVIEEKTEVIETSEEVIDFDLYLPDESIDPEKKSAEMKAKLEDIKEEKRTRQKAMDEVQHELIDPTQKSNNQENGSGQDEDS